jgi:hypothetical protein
VSEGTKLRLLLLAAMLALIAGIAAAVVAVDLVRTVLS